MFRRRAGHAARSALLQQCVVGKQPEDAVLTRDREQRNNKEKIVRTPVRDMRDAWRALTERAGLPRLLRHDLRRSAARALRAAGVPESVVMETGGWRTAAMFRRYAITNVADQREAVRLLEAARAREEKLRAANRAKGQVWRAAQRRLTR